MGSSRSFGFSESLLLSCLDDFLVLHDFLAEVDLWDSRDHFVKLQLFLPLLDICIGSWMLRDWLAAAFLCAVLLLVLRLVSVRSPLVCFCLPLALLFCLPLALLFCLLLALLICLLLALLFSILFIFDPDLRCSSRCPRTLVALLRSSHHWLCFSLTTGSLAVVPSVLLSQSHFVVGYDSVVLFWLPPTSVLSVEPFLIDGSL